MHLTEKRDGHFDVNLHTYMSLFSFATYNDIHLMIAIHRTARSKYKLFSSNKFVLLRSVSLSVKDRRNKIKVNIFDNIGSSFYIDFIFSVTISDDLI